MIDSATWLRKLRYQCLSCPRGQMKQTSDIDLEPSSVPLAAPQGLKSTRAARAARASWLSPSQYTTTVQEPHVLGHGAARRGQQDGFRLDEPVEVIGVDLSVGLNEGGIRSVSIASMRQDVIAYSLSGSRYCILSIRLLRRRAPFWMIRHRSTDGCIGAFCCHRWYGVRRALWH